jgi:hypothetical protein
LTRRLALATLHPVAHRPCHQPEQDEAALPGQAARHTPIPHAA